MNKIELEKLEAGPSLAKDKPVTITVDGKGGGSSTC